LTNLRKPKAHNGTTIKKEKGNKKTALLGLMPNLVKGDSLMMMAWQYCHENKVTAKLYSAPRDVGTASIRTDHASHFDLQK
jgi:hypothetical protein